jgi:hypothetical protein
MSTLEINKSLVDIKHEEAMEITNSIVSSVEKNDLK